MEQLRNLKQIYSLTAGRFNQYAGEDFVLPQIFKNQVKEINSNTITYNKYSAVIETRGNQNGVLNIYMPNQWFYIASLEIHFGFYNNIKKTCPLLINHPLFELRHNKHNHMKMFIYDNECAYFGSANITSAAVGRQSIKQRNYEAGMLVWGTNMMKLPLQHFELSWNDPCIIKHTWKRFAAKAKEIKKL